MFSLITIFFANNICANPGFRDGLEDMPMKKPPMIRIFENLDMLEAELKLSDKQLNGIEDINLKHEKKHLTYAEKLIPAHLKVKKLSLEKPIDYKEIRNILESTSGVMIDMKIGEIKHVEEIKGLLTSKQRLKLVRLNKRRLFDRKPFRDKEMRKQR